MAHHSEDVWNIYLSLALVFSIESFSKFAEFLSYVEYMMRHLVMVVILHISIASAVDTSGWYEISNLEYFVLSPNTSEDSAEDPFGGNPDVEFKCSSDIFKCVFRFTTRDTSNPAHWITNQEAFFYVDASEASLYFTLINHEETDDMLYSISIPAYSLTTSEINTAEFLDGSTISFNLEHIVDPYIYW